MSDRKPSAKSRRWNGYGFKNIYREQKQATPAQEQPPQPEPGSVHAHIAEMLQIFGGKQ